MIRIESAIARAKEQGIKVTRRDIAARLWPDATPINQSVKIGLLIRGKTTRIEPRWVGIICEMTGVSADFLLGISNE